MNAVGLDRPGIVSDLTKFVTDASGNVGESRALQLGDHFTLMMLCSVPGSNEEKLRRAFDNAKDLHVTTFKTRDPKTIGVAQKVGCKFEFFGVTEISSILCVTVVLPLTVSPLLSTSICA